MSFFLALYIASNGFVPNSEAGSWTIGKNDADIVLVRTMSLDWHYDDGIVSIPLLWINFE